MFGATPPPSRWPCRRAGLPGLQLISTRNGIAWELDLPGKNSAVFERLGVAVDACLRRVWRMGSALVRRRHAGHMFCIGKRIDGPAKRDELLRAFILLGRILSMPMRRGLQLDIEHCQYDTDPRVRSMKVRRRVCGVIPSCCAGLYGNKTASVRATLNTVGDFV